MKRIQPNDHPLGAVVWIPRTELRANHYNPNRVFTRELALLKQSILEDGWTQPIVARPDGEIVDGFHRWTLSADPEIAALSGGLIPVVRLAPASAADQMASTVRHNRARGQHGILKMSTIVREAAAAGMTGDVIEKKFGMEQEEIVRLSDTRPSPASAGKESFGKGWVPNPDVPTHADKKEARAASKKKTPRLAEKVAREIDEQVVGESLAGK